MKISFAELTMDVVATEWKRYMSRTGEKEADYITLGKVLSWCKRHKNTKTDSKYVRDQFKVPSRSIQTHIYRCSALFDVVLERRFPCFSEAEYDRLTYSHASRLIKQLPTLTDAKLAELLATGIDGSRRFRHSSKNQKHPKEGFIYVMVSSSRVSRSKLGGTRLFPVDRARDISRQTGNADPLVAVWWEPVSDWKKAEAELHSLFAGQKVDGKAEWFEVQAKKAIDAAMLIGPKYPVGDTP